MKRYIKSINIRLITLILMFSVFSTACSVTESHVIPDVFEMEKIDLSNKKYAMIFSADIWTKNQMENGRNILLLIDDEGNWDAYHIYNLDRANISWTSDGLYFSDHTYEYFIDNEGEIFKTNKMIDLEQATAQYGSSVNTDGAVWSWFDIGFDERGGYQTRITYQYKDKSIERVVEGQYNYLFTVDNQLYGISGNFKLENAINKEGRIGLVKFTGDDLTPTVLSSHPLPDESVGPVDISQQVIVKDHIIYVIGEAEAINDQFQTNLMMWNLDDGNLEVERIAVSTDHYGGELGYYSFYTHQNALQESELYWFNERAELKEPISKLFKQN